MVTWGGVPGTSSASVPATCAPMGAAAVHAWWCVVGPRAQAECNPGQGLRTACLTTVYDPPLRAMGRVDTVPPEAGVASVTLTEVLDDPGSSSTATLYQPARARGECMAIARAHRRSTRPRAHVALSGGKRRPHLAQRRKRTRRR